MIVQGLESVHQKVKIANSKPFFARLPVFRLSSEGSFPSRC